MVTSSNVMYDKCFVHIVTQKPKIMIIYICLSRVPTFTTSYVPLLTGL